GTRVRTSRRGRRQGSSAEIVQVTCSTSITTPLADVTQHSPGAGTAYLVSMDSVKRAVVLVEGVSDQLALEALAVRQGRNLASEGVFIVPMGGATNLGHFLDLFGPRGSDLRLAGLCDAAEEGAFRRALERAGLGSNLSRTGMERLGFYVCFADLE